MTGRGARILAIDVGAGTQDILIYEAGIPPENNVKLVMPSQTVIVGRRIQEATRQRLDVFLTGSLMGGGASSEAIRGHVTAGHRVYATSQAAKTVRDDMDQVRALGVEIVSAKPEGRVATVETRDVDLGAIGRALASFGLALPTRYAVAVQDHGESYAVSQRRFRFQMWESLLAEGGRLVDLAYVSPPAHLTRLRAVQQDVPGALVMDTAGAAIWGALQDEAVAAHRERGLVVVNVGNEHTLGILVRGQRIWGLFEHHTGRMDGAKLADHVGRLRLGTLTNEEVYDDGGHGCAMDAGYEPAPFEFVAVTGPNWGLADGLGYHRAAPHGDMMIAGCFGLVAAAQSVWREP